MQRRQQAPRTPLSSPDVVVGPRESHGKFPVGLAAPDTERPRENALPLFRALSRYNVGFPLSDKWKPITLADGVFDLDELKRDISTSDAKFAVRKYKPTALILEYLTSRSATQQVPLPSFMLLKSTAVKKKRTSEAQVDNHTKRFRKGRQRPLFLLDSDAEENDEQEDQQDDGEQDAQDPDAVDDSNWDSFAFVKECRHLYSGVSG